MNSPSPVTQDPIQLPPQAASVDSSFPVAGLLWMIVFHLGFLILTVMTYTVLIPEFWRMSMEFGVELPRATRFVVGIGDSLLVWPFLLVIGLLHLFAVGFYAVLAVSNHPNPARVWMRVSIILGLMFLIANLLVIGLPGLAMISGLTGE